MIILLFILIPLVATLLAVFVKKQTKTLEYAAIIARVLELALGAKIVSQVVSGNVVSYHSYFSVDSLGAILLMMTLGVGFFATLFSIGYLRREVQKDIIGFHRVREFYFFLHLFLFAMFLAIVTSNPMVTWIGIEATTLSTAFLISFYNKPTATEAAWKYIIINTVGLLLALFGTLIFFAAASQLTRHGLSNWSDLLSVARSMDPTVLKIAFVFVLVGYGTKMGLVPMHTWLPDAHSKAPVPISALLSGVLLNVALLPVLRFKGVVDAAIGAGFTQGLLIFFGCVSVIVASFILFDQKNYKRLLAYSSIENMGLMSLGFGFGGLGSAAALLHMLYHSMTKALLFFASGNIFLKYSSTKIANIRGAMAAIPLTATIFTVGFFAITAIPPFGLFYTEATIFTSGIAKHPVVVGAVIIALVVAFIGFFRQVTAMLFGEKPEHIEKGESNRWTTIPLVVLTIVLIAMSLHVPAFVERLINQAAHFIR